MARGSHPTPRWRRWALVGVLATVVVVAVNTAMSARSPAPARQLAEESYLDRVLPAIQDSTQEGRDIETVRSQAPTLGATTVGDRLQQVATSANLTLTQVRRLSPPSSLRTGHDLLVAALTQRAGGAAAFRQALAGALSGQGSASPLPQLVDVGRDFAAGDRSYAQFVAATPHLDVPLPASVWLADPAEYDQAEVTTFLATLRSAASLEPVHDTSVLVVTTDPPAVGMSGPTEILPPLAPVLNLQVVVADLGNQPERQLTVTATLAPSTGGPGQTVRTAVDLVAAQRLTVDLGGLRPPAGVTCTLSVATTVVPGETSTTDNGRLISLVMK